MHLFELNHTMGDIVDRVFIPLVDVKRRLLVNNRENFIGSLLRFLDAWYVLRLSTDTHECKEEDESRTEDSVPINAPHLHCDIVSEKEA